jgi:AcrR family transcriptional regulator
MTDAPTRRERLRSATLTEIKQVARRLVVEGGPAALSLRAIAREMGLSAAALYRYFPSLDALVVAVCGEIYDELHGVVAAAGTAGEEAVTQLFAMARGFRRWSIAHPQEFALLFGTPVPGMDAMDELADPDHPAARVGELFLGPFTQLWDRLAARFPPIDEARLAEYVAPIVAVHGDALPVAGLYAFLGAWTRLYGLVAMEVFGHLRWALTDVEPLFEAELAAFVRQLAVG